MELSFTSQFFAANRQRLRALFRGTAPIVITAAGQLQRSGDNPFPFNQDANFWYLTGIDEPDLILVMDRDREYLIVPARSASREAFDGALDPTELSQQSGIQTIYDGVKGWEELGKRLKKVKQVATVAAPPAYVEVYDMYTNPARAALAQRLKDANPEIELLDLSQHIVKMRVIKQPVELAALQQAIDVTIKGIKETVTTAKLKKYRHEYEVEAELTRAFRRRGVKHGFDPIIASGESACQVHPFEGAPVSPDDLIMLDVGAEVNHYSADISRTYAINPPTKRQQQVFDAVLEAQEHAISLLKPGVNQYDYELEMEKFVGEKLRELGLIRTIEHATVRKYFPHATSHFLGLNVHDVGTHDRTLLLEPGMVLTVEPGIYIRKERLGVRIEDDVLITPNGNKLLTGKLPRRLV